MTTILTNLASSAVVAAIKSNLNEYFHTMGQSPEAEMVVTPESFRWHTAVPHPWFNGVVSTHLPEENMEGLIQDTLSFFWSRNVETFSWWLAPFLNPEDWIDPLVAHGFLYDRSTPGMATDLESSQTSGRTPNDLNIVTVNDQAILRQWVHTFMQGYGLPESWEEPYFRLLASLGTDLPCRYYLGYVRDQPLAASTLFLGGGVAGVYNVSTLPAARGQGIGSALTLAALNDARLLDYRVGVLQSSEMGYGVYQRLGFREYCRMDHWTWS
jgi:ribosomal protein S18 acetylase RimI-like enzyme